MPRIEDRLLKAVVYLYASEEAAESGEPGAAGSWSGSLVRSRSRVPVRGDERARCQNMPRRTCCRTHGQERRLCVRKMTGTDTLLKMM